jgi:AP-1 complex subunit beta-1
MVKLANDKNVDQLLMELKEYASEIDVDFVRRAVRAIGQCALKIPEASERSINVLLDLVNTKVNYVVQEAVCVIKDILRKYPHRYENVIPTLAENLDALDDPAARASLIWMIGEYAEKITNAGELLETFLESFKDEPTLVPISFLFGTCADRCKGAVAVTYGDGETVFEEGEWGTRFSDSTIEDCDFRVR